MRIAEIVKKNKAMPGVYVIDNVFQVQWLQKGNINAHYPILHTYLLGFCKEAGKKSLVLTKPGLECIL